MKSKDKTKQKKHESTIGKIIYGFLLFMPLLAIGVTCAYAIFNKNAYQSYDGSIQYQQNINVEKPSDLVEGKRYDIQVINNVAGTTSNASYKIGFSQFTLLDYLINEGNNSLSTAKYFTIGGVVGITSNNAFGWYDNNNVYLGRTQLPLDQNIINNLYFTFTEIYNDSPAYYTDTFKGLIKVYNNVLVYENTLSNVFYYSIDKVQESPLFNWAENSVIYTGMANTCNAIDITTPFIPLLMTYWLIISVIYFLYDIILIILHVFHRKIHELEESI